MGDAENALPPTKKRVAGRELSRDNPGLDDDEESAEQETGTFKRASEEVLATRRIVKVRRNQPPSATGSPPSFNPFASIQLVPPIHSATNKPTSKESEKTTEKVTGEEGDIKETNGTEMRNEPDTETSDVKNDSVDETSRSTEENERKTDAGEEETENVSKTEANEHSESDKKSEEAGGDESKNESNASLSSFRQLSSSKNAFTGLAGTGFSSTSFSFGSFGKDGSGFGSGSGTVFGLKSENSSFPSFSFGSPNNGSSTKSEVSGVPSMQEVTVETGEENEKAIFTGDAVLFEYLDGGWKERGKGEVKVNASTEGPERARLVMRARGNYRLILNASLYPDMKLTSMDKRGITFACANSGSEGKEGLSTFALKFKDASVVDEFRGAVTAHKGGKSAVLKTPENSPKASDE